MTARRKILYVLNHMDWFWSHRLPLAQGAQDAGYDVIVAAPGAQADERLSSYGFTGIDLPKGNPLKAVLHLRRVFAQQKPDLVHAITLKYAFLAGLAAQGTGIRAVHTIAGLGYLFSGEGARPKILRAVVGPLLKLALNNRHTTLIFQNPDDRALMIRRGFAVPQRSVLIRGSGVDTAAFAVYPEPEGDAPLVLMPARLVREKGVAVFAEAARLLKHQGIKARFVIAGGLDRSNPNALNESDMQKIVADGPAEWAGKVTDMPALYAASSLIAYPSWYGEGVPKVLLEAASCGRAIVTTDHPGCREAVAHGENGLLVPVRDAPALAEAIRTLLDDPALRRRMGEKGREKAENEFDVQRIVRETLAVYEPVSP